MLPELSLTAVWPVTALPAVQDFLFSTLFFEWVVSIVACSNFCYSQLEFNWCLICGVLGSCWRTGLSVLRLLDTCRATCVEHVSSNLKNNK